MPEANKEKLSTLGIKVNQYTLERFNELKEDGAFDTSGQFLETLLERYSNPMKINKENETIARESKAKIEKLTADLSTANSNCEAQVQEINRLKDINVQQARMIDDLNAQVAGMAANVKQTEGHILVPVTELDVKCLQYLSERENKHYNRKDITPATFFIYAVREMLIKGNKFSVDCVPDRVIAQFEKEIKESKDGKGE